MTLAARVAEVSRSAEISQRAKEFCRLAQIIARGRGQHGSVQSLAHDNRVILGPRVAKIVESHLAVYELNPEVAARQKAAVSAGGTSLSDFSTWGPALAEYDTLASAFLELLRNWGAFDAMLPSMRRVPFRTRVGVSTTAITGSVVGQGAPKPISRLTLSGGTIDEIKVAAILVLTDELAKFGGPVAGDLFANELAAAVSVATDTAFVAILTAGATSIPSTGVTAEGVRNDLRALLAAITTNARSSLFLLVPSAVAKTLSVLHTNTGAAAFEGLGVNGGTIVPGLTVIVSDGVSAGTAVLVDASQVAAASETMQLSASNEAIVQMDSSPDSPPVAGSVMTSLWQANLTGLKAERSFAATKLSTTGVAALSGISYVGDSP